VRPGSSTAALACGGCAAVMRFEDGVGMTVARARARARARGYESSQSLSTDYLQ